MSQWPAAHCCLVLPATYLDTVSQVFKQNHLNGEAMTRVRRRRGPELSADGIAFVTTLHQAKMATMTVQQALTALPQRLG